jgi:hypothetical protein
MAETPNRRFELRAYESTNCCRLASFLIELAGEPPQPVDRDKVVERWTDQYPRHAEATGKRNVRGRITNALSILKAADIAKPGEGPAETPVIEILDHELVGMVASNLPVVEDAQGVAIPPGLWAGRPSVPDYLLEIQQTLIDQQQAQAAAAVENNPI